MEVVIVFVVAFIGLAVVARIGLSNATRERRSMSGHRQTLATISKVAEAPVADRDVRTFKVEPLRPVRLDLSKLDDLTDPDLIRITSPLASDDEPPLVEDPAADEDYDTARLRTHSSSEGDATVVHDASLEPDDREDLTSAQERETIDSGLVFGDEGLIGAAPGESELTAELIAAGEVDPSLLTQSMATVEAPIGRDEVDGKGPADEQDSTGEFGARGQHRVYSSGRRGVPLSAMAVGAGAIAVLLGVGFFVLGRNTSATVVQPSSTNRTQTTTPSKTSSTGSHPASSTKKKTGSGGSSSTTKQAKSTTGGNGSSGNSSSATPTSYTPVSSNASYATYDIPGGAKTIVVGASQPCWVADSDSANGALLWDETLPAGGSYTISSTAPSLWIKVGNAHEFQMQVNGVPVSFSAPPGVYAFNLVATSGQSPA
ncbi:DUF4115 domain-containing protein [Ferrimicrobium sp.]|uniref:DUF4115 domain-containing protein n=1 Tax=Ferrimicrobium sp. TaxID=2926050 RepID=UPI00261CD0B7|nr:DUF4115 domain-containing protein [Ferrimicrobium sp.]